MIHINILSKDPYKKFDVQWDKCKYPPNEYDIQFDSNENIDWDVVAVYENMHVDAWTGNCKSGGLIYISGEPPLMHPLPRKFTEQFDVFVGPYPKLKHKNKIVTHGFLNWSLGFGFFSKKKRYTFEQLVNLNPEKTKPISIVTSSKKMMPGHNLRQKMISNLKRDFGDKIDYFGIGEKDIDFKADALNPYFFHIALENCTVNDYWTEKFSDPVLARCIPIYIGCPNINKYFDKDGFIEVSYGEYDKLHALVTKILSNPQQLYNKYEAANNRNRDIILNKENLIPFLIDMARKNKSTANRDVKICSLNTKPTSMPFLMIRLKRLLMKLYINIRY